MRIFHTKVLFCQNITREKLRKALLYEKFVRKMLMKLTRNVTKAARKMLMKLSAHRRLHKNVYLLF